MENVGREEWGTAGRVAGTQGAKGKETTEERMKTKVWDRHTEAWKEARTCFQGLKAFQVYIQKLKGWEDNSAGRVHHEDLGMIPRMLVTKPGVVPMWVYSSSPGDGEKERPPEPVKSGLQAESVSKDKVTVAWGAVSEDVLWMLQPYTYPCT